jgi:ketosteroid isomerase-like protein
MYANTLETVIAKQDISDVMARYARAVDRADGPLLHSCYWDDAIEEHGSSYAGPARAYVDGAIERLQKTGVMAHYVCNSHVELDGDTAYVESYLLTFARFAKDGEPYDTLTGGRIVDRFERRGGEWRIAHRKMAFDWNRDQPSAETWCLGLFKPEDPRMVMGMKGRGDLSYSRF